MSMQRNMHGSSLFLGGRNGSTVTGTANLIMAAPVLAPGTTRIESATRTRNYRLASYS